MAQAPKSRNLTVYLALRKAVEELRKSHTGPEPYDDTEEGYLIDAMDKPWWAMGAEELEYIDSLPSIEIVLDVEN